MNAPISSRPLIKESMRIGGKKVDAEGTVPVHYPYTNEIIGTVPAGTAEHAAQAFAPQARTLAADRGIACVVLDYDAMKGVDSGAPTLF